MLEKIKETTDFITQQFDFVPEVGIVLGTGLGNLASEIEIKHTLSYKSIPNFPISTVEGHSGELIFGFLGNTKVVAMKGRFHFYEGYTMKEITFPIRVMKYLGIKLLILSNASGGVNPDYNIGDIMIIKDHINLMGTNPLIGKNDDELGARFPDMHVPYDLNLIEKAARISKENNISYRIGVYAAVTGPTYETPSEYRYIRTIGADAVGMSTVPEVIVARQMNLPCFAVSVISDLGVEGKIVKITHQEVINAASSAEPKITRVIKELINSLEF